MTWKSHRMTGGMFGYVLTHDIFVSVCVAILSTVPDLLEDVFGSEHRGGSHSVVGWGVVTLAAFEWRVPLPGPGGVNLVHLAQVFALGGVAHLLGDMLTRTGVPVFASHPRIALKMFSTGSVSEKVFVWLITVVFIIWLIWGVYGP